ncbi:MAG: hemerythrin domain-containing protein [Bryobacteraceae bacterium]
MPGDWVHAASQDLVRHIVTRHHAYARSAGPRLAALLAVAAARQSREHPELLEAAEIFEALTRELAAHMVREENVLFPLLESLGEAPPPALGSSLAAPIRRMTEDHDDAFALLARLRELTGGYRIEGDGAPELASLYRGLEEFEQDLHTHVWLENDVLFPRFAPREAELPGRVQL